MWLSAVATKVPMTKTESPAAKVAVTSTLTVVQVQPLELLVVEFGFEVVSEPVVPEAVQSLSRLASRNLLMRRSIWRTSSPPLRKAPCGIAGTRCRCSRRQVLL